MTLVKSLIGINQLSSSV
uniref:Uncharacterized protein n=1 Tax=Arundo donax TaxID=35708 RepID=A0A0A9C410_ARUDO